MKDRRQLTLKQRRFVGSYLKNGNGVKAALDAYDTEDYNTAHSIAVENLQKPTIRAAMEGEFEQEQMTREWALKGIKYLAENAEPSVSLRALEVAAKFLGLLDHKKEEPKPWQPSEEERKKMLFSLMYEFEMTKAYESDEYKAYKQSQGSPAS